MKKAALLSITAMALILPAIPASAQVEEIIVTARKRDERLLDVPVAVSALSSEQIARYATNSLASIGQQTPQLVIGESQNQVGGSINLRGIGAGTSNPSTEQSVTLNIDGVQVSYGNAVRLGTLDLKRVEVLKGPQALFFGKNSPGGIISLLSNDPGKDFEAQLRTGYEFEGQQKFVEGIVSGPLAEGLGARLVGYYSKEDGYFQNIGRAITGTTSGPGRRADSMNSEDSFIRGTIAYASPDNAFTAKFKFSHAAKDRDGIGPAALGQLVVCPFGASQVGNGATTDCKLDKYFSDVAVRPAVAALDPSFGDGTPYLRSRQSLGSLALDYALGDTLTLSSVTGLYKVHESSFDSFTFITVPAVGTSLSLKSKSFTQEVRLSSDFEGPVNFLAGGFYQDGSFDIRQAVFIDLGAPFINPPAVFNQKTRAWSAFGQARYKFTDQLELSAGGRLSRERKSLTGTVSNTPFTVLRPKRNFKDFSPEVTLTYKPSRDLTAYASYREGFTSGGFNTVPTTLRSPAFPTGSLRDVSFDQTTVKGEEVGFKGYLVDRQLRFDLTAYTYKYNGLQLSKFDPTTIATATQNAGGAKTRGIELAAVVQPKAVPGFEMRGGIAYNKSTYTEFFGGCYGGQSIAKGCNLVPRNSALPASTAGTAANPYTTQDQSGQDLTRSPRWSITAGTTYDHEISDTLGASISADVKYTSKYQTQIEAQPEAMQKGFTEWSGNISLYGGHDRGWQVALIGRNLTNRIVRVSGGAVAFVGTGTGTAVTTPADLFGSVNQPRSILLQLTLKSSVFGGN